MKATAQNKYIKYCYSQKTNSGFTLIELMVVIIIIGILTALGLPYFLNRAANAKQSEAQQFISTINKSQLAYRSQYANFSDSFDQLAIGNLEGSDTAETSNYIYKIASGTDRSSISAQAKDTLLKGYYGATLQSVNSQGNPVMYSIVCEAQLPGTNAPGAGNFGTSLPECPTDYTALSR